MHISEFSRAKTLGNSLQKCEKKSDMVNRVILNHILHKWASACVVYTKRTVHT